MKTPHSSKPPRPNPQQAGEAEVGATERIAKRMARAGLCSRREAEAWILAGRVVVNGKKLDTPAHVVGPGDRIEVDGAPLPANERTRLWLLNKRSGHVTTNRDPEGRTTIFEKLPADLPRVLSIGRLDINTEGLLLLTNDGGLARALELPSTGWLRRYRVRAHGSVTQEQLDKLKDGIAVDGVLYGSIEAELERQQGSNVWLTFAMREGKNREVKNVLGALNLDVNRLIRISYGPFQLGDLANGEVREVRGRTLRDQLGAKLIAVSGANFDTPETPAAQKVAQPKGRKAPVLGRDGKPRKKIDPLSRLDTKPRQAEKPSGKGAGKKAVKSAGGRNSSQNAAKPARAGKPGGKPNRGPNADRRR